jgi:alkanesulfonate monooxygenase SsuD/methylene tetrahydromethanopterin reductase-like flavin-dependent oxidoreductase (luciferase family)
MSLDFLREVSLIGSPSEVRDQIAAYSEAGVSHFELKFIYPTIERCLEQMRLFSSEVLQKMQ